MTRDEFKKLIYDEIETVIDNLTEEQFETLVAEEVIPNYLCDVLLDLLSAIGN